MILAAIVLARLGFGYQFQTVGSLGPTLIPLFAMDYTTFGKLIGAFMLVGTFAALPLGLAGGRFGDRVILAGGLALMVAGGDRERAGRWPGRHCRRAHGLRRRRGRHGGDPEPRCSPTGSTDAASCWRSAPRSAPIRWGSGWASSPSRRWPPRSAGRRHSWPADVIQAAALALFLASFRDAPPHGAVHARRAAGAAQRARVPADGDRGAGVGRLHRGLHRVPLLCAVADGRARAEHGADRRGDRHRLLGQPAADAVRRRAGQPRSARSACS